MKVGEVIARLETDVEDGQSTEQADEKDSDEEKASDRSPADKDKAQPDDRDADEKESEDDQTAQSPAEETEQASEAVDDEETRDRPPAAAAPSIRRLARELGVDIHDVGGSGPRGRITEADIKSYVRKTQAPSKETADAGSLPRLPKLPDFSRWGEIDIEEMETVRRLTAESTATSWTVVPHVTQFDEADITEVTAFIQTKAAIAEKAGTKLTVTAVITRVCAEALKRFPRFNASIDVTAHRIILKRYVNIGIAADTPRGLLVPVIRDADQKSIMDLAQAIGDLASRARNKKVRPDELEGGTFSISNQGGIGGVAFTPIVLWPQVAILGVSRSTIKPVWNQERFEPRTVLPLSLSYDHRIIDGADAARFLRWICDGLQHPLTLFLE
jgi:pyruvate dehydrogenase E2 component (dihydrolipoamide acetyltransferase)